jgi:hypothetical protein
LVAIVHEQAVLTREDASLESDESSVSLGSLGLVVLRVVVVDVRIGVVEEVRMGVVEDVLTEVVLPVVVRMVVDDVRMVVVLTGLEVLTVVVRTGVVDVLRVVVLVVVVLRVVVVVVDALLVVVVAGRFRAASPRLLVLVCWARLAFFTIWPGHTVVVTTSVEVLVVIIGSGVLQEISLRDSAHLTRGTHIVSVVVVVDGSPVVTVSVNVPTGTLIVLVTVPVIVAVTLAVQVGLAMGYLAAQKL